MNKYCAIGNVSLDISLYKGVSSKGKEFVVASTSVAINSHHTDADGERKAPLFMPIKVFGKMGENMHKFLKKGSKIGFVGSLDTEDWEDRETGKKRDRTYCLVESLEFLDKKPTDGTDANASNEEERF